MSLFQLHQKLMGKNLGRVFNSKCVVYTMQLHLEQKQPILKLKTRPNQKIDLLNFSYSSQTISKQKYQHQSSVWKSKTTTQTTFETNK